MPNLYIVKTVGLFLGMYGSAANEEILCEFESQIDGIVMCLRVNGYIMMKRVPHITRMGDNGIEHIRVGASIPIVFMPSGVIWVEPFQGTFKEA